MKKSYVAAALLAGMLSVVGTGAMAATHAAHGAKHHKNSVEHDCKAKHKNNRKGYKGCVQEHKTGAAQPAM